MDIESLQFVLARVGVALFYLTLWLVTRYFYRKHKPEIIHAVEDGRAQQSQVIEESTWFQKASLWLAILGFVGMFVPQGWWLVGYLALTTVGYAFTASFVESMLRSSVRRAEYEPEDQSEPA